MQWLLKPADDSLAAQLSRAASIPMPVARLLVQRGIATADVAHSFLNPSLDQLHSPFEMLGMQIAVDRLERAIAAKERVLIYGDYDVDGTVAVVILKTCIELLGGVTEFHVPHRIREGYGIKDSRIEASAADGITLVISVDTGIRAFAAADTARRLGLDLIVTDHHLPEAIEGVPQALAVLNPNQKDCSYPNKGLCGAGVAFKVAQALLTRAGRENLVPSFLKMVAIATIADSVPLTGENRVMTKLGLDGLRRPVNGGLKALMQVAQLENLQRPISTVDIGFRLAPRINAAGRMDIAQDVVDLFTTRDALRHRELAAKLNELNTQRQAEEQCIIAAIHALLDSQDGFRDPYCLVIDGDDWHRGVIGIAATRIVERTGKPTLIISHDKESGEAHGSGRSISAFHLLDALESAGCRPLFTRFGGHAHAVGFSMPSASVPELRLAMDAFARTQLAPEDFLPVLSVDTEIEIGDITPQLLAHVQKLEPFGVGNREPIFISRNVRVLQSPRVMKEKHAKLKLATNGSRSVDALGWRMAEQILALGLLPGDKIDIAYTLEENTNPDFAGLQLVIKDLQRSESSTAVQKAGAGQK